MIYTYMSWETPTASKDGEKSIKIHHYEFSFRAQNRILPQGWTCPFACNKRQYSSTMRFHYQKVQNQVRGQEEETSSRMRNCPTSKLFFPPCMTRLLGLGFGFFWTRFNFVSPPNEQYSDSYGYRSVSLRRRKVLHPKFWGVFFLVAYQGSRFTLHITSKSPFTDTASKPIFHWAHRLNTICF